MTARQKGYTEKQFEEAFRQYYPRLVAFIERHVGDTAQAQDLAQDVFFKLYESSSDFPNTSSLKSWLYTTSRNIAIDYLRHLKVEDNYQLLTAEALMYTTDIDEGINETLVKKINEALNALPEQCRQIVKMNITDGYKYSEIAEILGISVNTVRTQISRGYKKLRELLSEDFKALVLIYFQLHKTFLLQHSTLFL